MVEPKKNIMNEAVEVIKSIFKHFKFLDRLYWISDK